MKPAALLFKTFLLTVFTLSLVAGAIFTDYYLRHEVTRQARRFLAEQGVEVTVDSAIRAARAGELILLENLEVAGISLGLTDSKGHTPLLEALKGGNPDAVEFLLDRDVVSETINSVTDPDRETPLAIALRERDFGLADRLILLGADPNVDKEAGLPFIVDAVRNDDTEMLEYLLNYGADVDYRGAQPTTALAYAAAKNDLETMRTLLHEGASPDARGISGKALVIEAAKEGSHEKLDVLLGYNVDVNATTGEAAGIEMSALSYAVDREDLTMQRTLLKKGARADVFATSGEPLIYAAVIGDDMKLANRLLKHGASPNRITPAGDTPLVAAIERENLDMVGLLLESEADPSLTAKDGRSPLSVAVSNGNIAIAHQLVALGADTDPSQLLATAYEKRDDPLMNLILNAGADPEATFPGTDQRIFDTAVMDGATGAVRTLLASGASIGDNLWAALLTGQDDLIRLILDAGADPRQKGPEGQDPLAYCLNLGRYKAARTLLEGGADPNAMATDDESWLSKSLREGNAEMALALVESGAEVEGKKTNDGHSFLAWAIAHQMADVTKALLDAGADPNVDEMTPARPELREMFESTTFRYHLQYDRGVRPIMMAAAHRNHEIAQILMDGGAKGTAYTRKYLMAAIIGSWYKDTKIQQIALLGKVPDPQPRRLVVDLSSQTATLYENGVATYSTRCSTGKSGYGTPPGEYVISDRHRHHTSTIYHSSMPYFQRFSFAAFGIHQGYVPNYPASHGCIRLPYEAARYLFGKLEVGDFAVVQR